MSCINPRSFISHSNPQVVLFEKTKINNNSNKTITTITTTSKILQKTNKQTKKKKKKTQTEKSKTNNRKQTQSPQNKTNKVKQANNKQTNKTPHKLDSRDNYQKSLKVRQSYRLVGLVVKASVTGAEDPGFELDFFGSSNTRDFKIGTPVATLPGAWHYMVSSGTGRPGVSIM